MPPTPREFRISDFGFRIFGNASGNSPRSPEVPGILSGSATKEGTFEVGAA